jgi:hypothetical protein
VQGGIENEPPLIIYLKVSPEIINPGDTGTVIVNATDSAGDILEYKWSISDGVINDLNKNETTFTAPDDTGTITIEVKISDQNDGVAQGSIQATVAEEENANAGAQVIVNLTVSPATITTGGQGAVTVNVTGYDGNISGLKYEWSISGGGAINNENGNTMTFAAPNDPGTITIKVTISDQSGVVATGSIQVTVAGQSGQSSQDVQIQEGQSGQGVQKPVDEAAFGN